MRYWFLVFDDHDAPSNFGGACFVPVPRSERSITGAERAARASGLIPPGAHCFGQPCPYSFTPPTPYLDKVLSFVEWESFWLSCAQRATS